MFMIFSITAISSAAIFLLYFTQQKTTSSPPLSLSVAVILAATLELFDLLALYNPGQVYYWKKFSLVSEALLLPAWLWFSLTYARQQSGIQSISIPFRFLLASSPLILVFATILPTGSLVYSPDFAAEKILFLSNYGFFFYLLMLAYLVAVLIQLEQTLVQTSGSSRWKIKFELLGAGAFIAVLVIYYSQGLLFRTLNMQMVSLRSTVLIVAIAMMFYSRLKRGSGVTVHISQQVACKSVVLLAVGMYIICLGLVGEAMRYFGDGFQRAMILSFAFIAGIGLFVLLLSESLKRKVTIFIHKNFYQSKYDYRKQWLQFTDRLSASQTSNGLLHSIVLEFCNTFGMGSGALFVINQERERYQQVTAISIDRSDVIFKTIEPIIERLASSKWIIDLRNNVTISDSEHHNAFFNEISACFIIPLFINETMDGFVILGRPLSYEELYTYEDFDLMRTLAKQASSALLNLRLSDQLACARELAAIGKVSAFVMHDLKNLVSSVSLLLENAQEHISTPAFQKDMFMSLGNTIIKMRSMISRLKHMPEKESLQLTPVDLLQMAHDTAAMITVKTLEVSGTRVIAEVDRDELQKVALNLMLNAVEATDGNSPVRVEVGEEGSPFIRVRDEGCGISEAFRQHVLFKPFSSTKKKGMGIGLYQSRQIIEAHGGRIEVDSCINRGSEFTVWLPKMHAGIA